MKFKLQPKDIKKLHNSKISLELFDMISELPFITDVYMNDDMSWSVKMDGVTKPIKICIIQLEDIMTKVLKEFLDFVELINSKHFKQYLIDNNVALRDLPPFVLKGSISSISVKKQEDVDLPEVGYQYYNGSGYTMFTQKMDAEDLIILHAKVELDRIKRRGNDKDKKGSTKESKRNM